MDDLVRSRRKSTIEKSDRLKEIELERKNAKLKNLNKKACEAETTLIEETVEPADSVIDVSHLGAVGGEIVSRNPNSNLAAADDEGSEEEEEYFDPFGAIKSPSKRESGRKVDSHSYKKAKRSKRIRQLVNQIQPVLPLRLCY